VNREEQARKVLDLFDKKIKSCQEATVALRKLTQHIPEGPYLNLLNDVIEAFVTVNIDYTAIKRMIEGYEKLVKELKGQLGS
jgi:hypothetical protein